MTNPGTITLAVLGACSKLDLSTPAALTLMALTEAGGEARVTDLYPLVSSDGSNVRRATYQLEEAKLIKRKANGGGKPRRGVPTIIAVTAKGKKVVDKLNRAAQEAMA